MDRFITSLELKMVDETKGIFSGYGAAYGNVDKGRDLIEPGAFTESMAEHKAAGTMPGMFWNHQQNEPIGEWTGWSSDQKGLLMEGQLWLGKGIAKAEQAYMMLKSQGPKGLSIGYTVRDGGEKYDGKVRRLSKLTVGEISPVVFPMNTKATIVAVKSDNLFGLKNEDGSLKTIRDFERILRDAGLSDREAKSLLSGGYAKMDPRDGEMQELLNVIRKAIPTTPA